MCYTTSFMTESRCDVACAAKSAAAELPGKIPQCDVACAAKSAAAGLPGFRSSSAPKCQTLQKRPKVSHSPPEREVEKSTEGKPRLNEALKNRKENSPANLHALESSKLTVQVHRNLPSARLSAVYFMNSRNPHSSLFRTSAGIAHSTTND
uniref:Uncharacterized protein n=1 Tax=Heterorhabditis bacteriophora TaxID=37862 RepID=A0A1I7XCX4_HETBA